jgi:hypothetical protein
MRFVQPGQVPALVAIALAAFVANPGNLAAAFSALPLFARAETPPVASLATNRSALADCNAVFDAPSKDSFDTMPLSGLRGAGANVWFQDGALWLYLAHSGAWDERSELIKLGALRMTPVGADFTTPKSFRQELDLPTGGIRIEAEARDGTKIAFALWFAEETLVIESRHDLPLAFDVEYGSWRAKPGARVSDPEQVETADGCLRFFHRNGPANRAIKEAKQQNVPADTAPKIAQDRVFGGALAARGGLSFGEPKPVAWQIWIGHAWPTKTVVASEHLLTVALGAGRFAKPEAWQARATALLAPEAPARAHRETQARWDEFWGRSHVFIRTGAPAADSVAQIGRNYQRFRYMTACNQGAEMPLKFNGGVFTSDPRMNRVPPRLNNPQSNMGGPKNPDYIRWFGNMYMSQNQRWIGWPTIANGDADLLGISSAFYRDRLGVARVRAKNVGATGACYIEPLNPEGLCCVAPTPQGLCGAKHLKHHFAMGLEHAWMTLKGHEALGGDITPDLPWMTETVRFFDSFYRAKTKETTGKELTGDGKLRLYPCNGLELVAGATNPIETVAGLRRVTEGLLALPELPAADRAFLTDLLPRLPELPVTERQGRKVLALADKWESLHNGWEFPELFTVWPYRLTGITRPDTLPLARATWETQEKRGDHGSKDIRQLRDLSWQPTLADAAALGLTDEAARLAVAKMSDAASPCRFPAFFGPGHDWMPDHNWGSSGMVGVQEMLMACNDGKILLFPAWPKTWDVNFRLHAPQQTVVEGELKDGKLVVLKVTPESRRKDVRVMLGETSR